MSGLPLARRTHDFCQALLHIIAISKKKDQEGADRAVLAGGQAKIVLSDRSGRGPGGCYGMKAKSGDGMIGATAVA